MEIRRQIAPDQGFDEVLLALDELDAIALERPAVGADGTQGLALVDETPDLLGERLDRGQMKNFR